MVNPKSSQVAPAPPAAPEASADAPAAPSAAPSLAPKAIGAGAETRADSDKATDAVGNADSGKALDAPSLSSPSKQVADEDRIPLSRKIIFSAPTMATLPFLVMWGMHGNKSYQEFGASLAMIALFTALARSFDVISDPLMSYITDSDPLMAYRDKLPKWLRGRRKPFMFFGCFIYSTLLFLLLNPPYASETGLSVWFGLFYTSYFLSNTMTTIPYDALGPELSEDSNERTGLFFVANLFDGIGTLIAVCLPIMATAGVSSGTIAEGRNEFICKKQEDLSDACINGRSCGNFLTSYKSTLSRSFEDGFEANSTLEDSLSNMTYVLKNIAYFNDVSRVCSSWMRTTGAARAPYDILNSHPLNTNNNATVLQTDAFCYCVESCDDACNVANTRTGFMIVGLIFAFWFVITMLIAVCVVPERIPEKPRPKAPPIVPSMRSALDNRLFRILLPAWLCDAFVTAIFSSLVPYFIEAVLAPAYQTEEDHGRDCYPSSSEYQLANPGKGTGKAGIGDDADFLCDTNNVLAVAGMLALVTAILVLPVWKFLVSYLGKVKTWFLWSLTMAGTNVLLLFVFKGQIEYFFFAAAMNGAPLGAKFLADAILADIIDYDEFLTGMRSEATYFMFKSFLPKIVQIPASAIPVALLKSFDYKDPVGGKPSDQPNSVAVYVRFVVGTGFIFSLLAYFLKTRYPLRHEAVARLADALKVHKEPGGKLAPDPVSGRLYKPMKIEDDDEQEAFWLFNHFTMGEMKYAYITMELETKDGQEPDAVERFCAGCKYLMSLTQKQCMGTIGYLVFSLAGTAATIGAGLLQEGGSEFCSDDDTEDWCTNSWQFVPVLFVVSCGVGISFTAFASLRYRAAKHLSNMACQCRSDPTREEDAETVTKKKNLGTYYDTKVKRLLEHQEEIYKLGQSVASSEDMLDGKEPLLPPAAPTGDQPQAPTGASGDGDTAVPQAATVRGGSPDAEKSEPDEVSVPEPKTEQ
jgi:Na+/melibiose symporter-like transporter